MIKQQPKSTLPPTASEANLAFCLREIATRFHVDFHEIAARCNVTYQTVKNVADGRAVNARFISALIESFALQNEREFLNRILLGFLILQFKSEGGSSDERGLKLLRNAGLIQCERSVKRASSKQAISYRTYPTGGPSEA